MRKLLAALMSMLGRVFSPAAVRRGLGGRRPAPAPAPQPQDGYERRDIPAIPTLLTGLGLLVTVAIISGIVWGMFTFLLAHPRADVSPSPLVTQRVPSSAPLLDSPAATADIQEALRRANETLSTYGWVDRQHGIVRMPIDRAIDLLTQRPLPARPAGQAGATSSTGGQALK